jgi:hypothetical protein
MFTFMDIMTVVGLFLLRFGVPVAVMALAVYFLKRVDARWEAEARAERQLQPTAEQPATAPAQQRPPRKPAPQPQPIFIPPGVKTTTTQVPLHAGVAAASKPCWEVKGCSEESKAACTAPQHPDKPCWQARLDADGAIPEECVTCDIFQRYPMM